VTTARRASLAIAVTTACGCLGPHGVSKPANEPWRYEVVVPSAGTTIWVRGTGSGDGQRALAWDARTRPGDPVIAVGLAPGSRAMDDGDVAEWVATSATVVSRYLGGWPVDRALVFVSPGEAGKIDGETLDDRGGTIFLRVGCDVSLGAASKDWVLVHEMIHLVLPGLGPPHQWLEEGIATYVEPIARARAGVISDASVWSEWLASMPQGLPEAADEGLDRTHTWARTYWGGAIYCLAADIEIRRSTRNQRSLDDALRAISRGSSGVAEHWPIERLIATGDAATGVHVLRALYGRLALAPGTVDLAATWRDLGVSRSGESVAFDDGAPLAYVRRAITHPEGAKGG